MTTTPRFHLGQTVITRKALAALQPEEVVAALGRHVLGDWGEVPAVRSRANDLAVRENGQVVSAFRSETAGGPFYVVTAADRSETTVFLPDEVTAG